MGTPLRKSPGVPERRGRRGTAPIAPDRIPFQRPELPRAEAIVAVDEIEHIAAVARAVGA
jgi:hypothetical protein